MFVGHYGVALAAKRFDARVPLGWTFLAVQLLDVLSAPFVVWGIEHARVIPGYLPASSVYLYDIPWSHSLAMAVIWSWFASRLSKSYVVGACVFSHWLLDLVVHWHDLPLYRGSHVLLGLGLWRSAPGTLVAESLLLIAGLVIYMRATRATAPGGRFAMPAFVAVLIALGVANIYGPPPPTIRAIAIAGEAAYVVFSLIAGWLDRLRTAG